MTTSTYAVTIDDLRTAKGGLLDIDIDGISAYEGPSFEFDVKQIAEAVTNIQQDRDLPHFLLLDFTCDSEGTIDGANVSVHVPGSVGIYVGRFLEVKRLTDKREAEEGAESAEAILGALNTAHAEVLQVLREGWRSPVSSKP